MATDEGHPPRLDNLCALSCRVGTDPFVSFYRGSECSFWISGDFAELAAESGAYLCDPLDGMRNHPEEERKDFRFRTDSHLSSAKTLASLPGLKFRIRDMVTQTLGSGGTVI